MLRVPLVLLGPGKIGKSFLKQYLLIGKKIQSNYGIKISISGIFDSQNGIVNDKGIPSQTIKNIVKDGMKAARRINSDALTEYVSRLAPPFIIVDTTAAKTTAPVLLKALNIRYHQT